jgi:hypothetical protein
MTQVELPPHRGPHSLMDSIDIEIIFGRIFEAFQWISQAAIAGAVSIDDNKPLKRCCRPSLKKAMVSRYSCILFLYLRTRCNSDVSYSVGHPMLMSHQKLLSNSLLIYWWHLLWLLLLLPLLWQGAGLMTCSYNDAMSSTQQVLRYLESLKDAEVDLEDNRSSFIAFMLLVLLLTLFFLLV